MITATRQLYPDYANDTRHVDGTTFTITQMNLRVAARAFNNCRPAEADQAYKRLGADLQEIQIRLDRLSSYDAQGSDYKTIMNAIDNWCLRVSAYLDQKTQVSARSAILRVLSAGRRATASPDHAVQLRGALARVKASTAESVTHRYFDAPDVGFEAAYS